MNTSFPSSIVSSPASGALAVIQRPVPRCGVSVREAVADLDLGFIDQLQKMHSHMVGFLPYKAIVKRIKDGHVVIAEDEAKNQIGYCIAEDRYLKRDDVGIVYQLNVLPLKQRNLVGALLVKAMFDRAAYGCKLFSCWCAQDIRANWFWESIGFVPLAFRSGSRSKERIHIFWQRRIREGDTTTPYWFPSQTSGGAVAEDRLVLPISTDTHWRDAKPLVLPGISLALAEKEKPKLLPGGQPVRTRPDVPKLSAAEKAQIKRTQSRHLGGIPMGKKAVLTRSGFKYVDRTDFVPELDAPEIDPPKPKRTPKPKHVNDPKYVREARDLRDKFLEAVNSGLCLPGADLPVKYDVSRQLESQDAGGKLMPLLRAA